MAYNHAPQANGFGPNGQSQYRQLRVPTVNEALPYSPFSSVVPFNPDLITAPMALPSTEPTAFDDLEDIKAARRDLERLAAQAHNTEAAKKRHEQTLDDFKRLLEPGSLPEYKFRTSKRAKADMPPSKAQPKLSNFANSVYEGNHVTFSYVTPEASPDSDENIVVKHKHKRPTEMGDNIVVSPRRPQLPGQQALKQPIKKMVVKHPDLSSPRQSSEHPTPKQDALPQAVLPNGHLNVQHATPTPPKSTPKAFVRPAVLTQAQRAEYQVVSPLPTPTPTAYAVTASLTPAQLAEYQKVSVPDEQDSTPSRNQSAYLTNGSRSVSLGQRQKAEQAVQNMQSLLSAIFEAEDQMQPNASGYTSMESNVYFASTDVEEGSTALLTSDALLRVDAVATKVYAHNCIGELQVGHLARVQKLCEAFLATSESGLLHISEDWEEHDVSNWLSRLTSAHHGLIAARIMMRIMAGGSRYKELQSEDHLRLVLDTVRTAVEGCIIPIIEMRSTSGGKIRGEKAAPNPAFNIAVENRKALQAFMKLTTKCTQLLGDLFYKTDVDESGISSLEYLCKTLIFAENATSDRDSALGTQSFEDLRKAAMDGLARIFEKYTSQRTFIVDEMLLSLDKLPATKQSARQYTLPDAKPIQLVSALLMRLVQTSATADLKDKTAADEDEEEEESEESVDDDSDDSDDSSRPKKKSKTQRPAGSKLSKDLSAVYIPLKRSTDRYAAYIVQVLLDRALGSSKSSDEPYRRLLDIFVDDFLNVMGSTDWPAAELLLRALVVKLFEKADNPKSPAPSRTLALEVLGTVGSGILDIRASALNGGSALDTDDPISARLADVVQEMKNGDLSAAALTAFEGPYRVVIEYLDARDNGNDPLLQSARGYHLVQWADIVCNKRGDTPDGIGHSTAALQTSIQRMIEDRHWLGNAEPDFPRPTTDHGKIAGRLAAANAPLCKAFSRIFTTVLKSLSSEQPTVRSRSLKSVNTLLEKDPSVLDRDPYVLDQIVRCLRDASSLVRDSALGLLQKCVALRPKLELRVYKEVLPRTNDTAVGVRKRAMAFLKDVYLRSDDNTVRAPISNALLSRMQDNEESVAEVARATIEEVWFTSFRDITSNERSVDAQIRLSSHAALIIQTVELGDNVATVLEKMVKKLLTTSKQAPENVRISKMFVAVIAELMKDQNIPGSPSQATVVRTLDVFARSWPKLFTPAQLSHLEPFTKNLSTMDDLDVFVHVVNILNFTLPVVIGVEQNKLELLMVALLTSITKPIPKAVVAVVAPCLATLDALLGHTTRLFTLCKSALGPVYDERQAQAVSSMPAKTVRRLIIVGQLGKSCDLDRHLADFKKDSRYSWYRGDNSAGLLLEIICYHTSPRQPLIVREAAIDAICEICQSYPEHFERADVVNAIEAVFQARIPSLEAAMLTSLEVFFATGVAGGEVQEAIVAGIEGGAQRLGGTYKATGHDKASAALSQRFMPQFLRIALSSASDVALTAARIVVHINTSGLSYPQDSAPGLVALETCPNSAIASLAFQAHKEQFTKYESIFEKQLVKAVQRAFQYQVQVVQNAAGCSGNPPTAKLHFFWDVTKTGKAAVRQKFATNICVSMNFDPAKLELKGSASPHLQYVRFCVENIAFFDYTSVSEVLHLLSALAKTVAGTGTEVAQAIESDIQKIQVPVSSSSAVPGEPNGIVVASTEAILPTNYQVDPQRLEQLSVSAQILSLLWETRTYLLKLWTMQRYTDKPKAAAKDASRAPTRATNAPSLTEAFQKTVKSIMAPLDSENAKRAMCGSFVDMYNIDPDKKVGSDDEDNMELDDEDDARSVSSMSKSPSVSATPRGKKRKSVDSSMNGGPKKRGRPRKSSISKKDDFDEDGGWD